MNAISRDKKQENRPSTNFISRRNLLVTSTSVFAAASIQSSALITSAKAQQHGPARTVTPSSEELTQRTTERRGVEVAIWGMPIVNFDAMRQAFFRDAKATYSDIMFWSKPGSWKLQCLTPNTSVRYVFSFINTSQAGPVVVELPATADAALNGTIIDAWQVPLTDVGIAGEDQGKGGKYLLVPPDYRMVSEEPVQPRDAGMMRMLRTLGIDKGKEFKSDETTRAALKAAAQEAHAWFMDRLVTYGVHYWSDGKWDVPAPPIGPKSGFTWEADGILDVDARGIAFFSFFCPPKKLGTGQFYLVTFFDGGGQRLRGGETYRLRVPGDVPVTQFWSVTVYEHATCALIRNAARPSMDSYDTRASKNADGSMDVYFGPKALKGLEANWIPTVAGKDWFPYFRFYGPQQPLFAKSWKLPDIKKMS